MNSISIGYSNIDRIHSIEKEREEIQSSKEYRDWCKKYNIGSRVEIRDSRATELMNQYSDRYTNWIKSR
jgi:hypothetical protein